jgi:surfactin synthase thioesterase subunit
MVPDISDDSGLRDLWIRKCGPQAGDAPLRLLCFPHAGGSASFYQPLAAALGGSAQVLAVQYPGRQDRRNEPSLVRIGELAESVVDALTPWSAWSDRPLAFFGHSMGAVIAYEVARIMEQQTDATLLGLVASGRRAPSVHVEENLHRQSDAGLLTELRQMSGTAASLLHDEEVVRMILPPLRADYEAIETYRHQPGHELRSPLAALIGKEDGKAPLEHVREWESHTSGHFELHQFPGGHFYLNEQWDAIADTLRDCLRTQR